MISAAERSGDEHAASLVKEVRALCPEVDFQGFGGQLLTDAGCKVHTDLIDMASMAFGFLRYVPRYAKVVRAFDQLLRRVRPAAVVVVDSPGLHFVFARLAKWRGIPVIYYICPQIWAWAPWRRKKVLRYTDLLLTILPFETTLYENDSVPVKFVGHPLADGLEAHGPDSARQLREDLAIGEADRVIGILPGSRTHEVEELMPLFRTILDAMELTSDTRVVVSCFRPRFESIIRQALDGAAVRWDVVPQDSKTLSLASDFVLVASGTASLEAAYFERPMLVLYRKGAVEGAFLNWLAVTPYFALPNILGASLFDGRPAVHEQLCRGGEGAALAALAAPLLNQGKPRDEAVARLRQIREAYLQPGAARRAASEVVSFLAGRCDEER